LIEVPRLRIGIGLNTSAHSSNPHQDWRDYWSAVVARFDRVAEFLTLEDGFARDEENGLDAILLANWLAPRSLNIGIIAGAPVNFLEPFHISTAIATLDYVSQGRAGLLAQQLRGEHVSQAGSAIGALGGFPALTDEALEGDARDALEVIRRLWDSWETDAVIRDEKTQRFLDGSKLHYINFEGSDFRVLGPSITPRPPQGQPLVATVYRKGNGPSLERDADIVFVRPGKNGAVPSIAEIHAASARDDQVFILDVDIQAEKTSGAALVDLISRSVTLGIGGVRFILADARKDGDFLLGDVLPLLHDVGLIREPAGGSLRERFGLPVAVNRYTVAA
jgi:alkanesulfonate monooxygenase SsuD/methylene tetrahydromethanopterin reductase-like flavin-dependent oxidoreductase (luciferase family)